MECLGQLFFKFLQCLVVEAALAQSRVVDTGGVAQGAAAYGVFGDILDLGLVVAQGRKRHRHGAVDDLEKTAAGQRLVLDQGEIGFDAGGVAIHHQADGAGGRHHRGLGVAVAEFFAQLQRLVPGLGGGRRQIDVGAGLDVERHRVDRKAFIAVVFAIGGAAMVADHPQHGFAIFLKTGEGAELLRHLGGGGVGHAGEDGGKRAGKGAAGA